jgi:hypothetical protein
VRVRSRRGPWAADVRASMWHKQQLLLQTVADGRTDGHPGDVDLAVSDKILLGPVMRRLTKAVLSPTRLAFFRGLC